MNNTFKGYLFGITAAATYGMNPLFALPLYGDGMDTDSVLFLRYILALPVLGLMIKLRGRNFRLRRREVLPLMLMGVLMSISSVTLFESYHYMAAGIASTILFVYPIMVALIMAIFFRERLSLQTVLCILLAVGGIALLYEGDDGQCLSTKGVLLVIASALAYAIYLVAVNNKTLREIATLKLTFYVLLFGGLVFFARIRFGSALHLPQGVFLWSNVLALSVFPTAISFLCTTRSIQYIGSTPTAILGALEPLTAVFFGVLVFGESLTIRVVCGIMMIVFAVTIIIAGNKITPYMIRFRKLFPRLPIPRK